MAVKIRLRQQGRKNRQTFRLVATDIRFPRDGKYLEMLGWYNPFQAENNFVVNEERVTFWINNGAQLSEQAKTMLTKVAPSLMKSYKTRLNARRLKRVTERKELKKGVKAASAKTGEAKTPAAKKPAAKKTVKKAAE